MKRAFLALAGACLLSIRTSVHPLSRAPDPPQALAAAEQWLALLDAGRLDDAWAEAATEFQAESPRATWVAALRRQRLPLGALRSRTLNHSHFGTTFADAPAGGFRETVDHDYSGRFERRPLAVETLTTIKGSDGVWRVRRYAVR